MENYISFKTTKYGILRDRRRHGSAGGKTSSGPRPDSIRQTEFMIEGIEKEYL
jgi:hypothetical protein